MQDRWSRFKNPLLKVRECVMWAFHQCRRQKFKDPVEEEAFRSIRRIGRACFYLGAWDWLCVLVGVTDFARYSPDGEVSYLLNTVIDFNLHLRSLLYVCGVFRVLQLICFYKHNKIICERIDMLVSRGGFSVVAWVAFYPRCLAYDIVNSHLIVHFLVFFLLTLASVCVRQKTYGISFIKAFCQSQAYWFFVSLALIYVVSYLTPLFLVPAFRTHLVLMIETANDNIFQIDFYLGKVGSIPANDTTEAVHSFLTGQKLRNEHTIRVAQRFLYIYRYALSNRETTGFDWFNYGLKND